MKRMMIWPSYFDVRLTVKRGRRVPKALAVEGPTAEEVAAAAQTLGLEPELEPDKAFPSVPWARGRVFVSRQDSKQETIRKIGAVLRQRRGSKS